MHLKISKGIYNRRKKILTGNSETKKNAIATDSFILTFVQCLTMVVSLAQAMILSRTLTKEEYGTYGQALLIINLITPFLLLGLSNAVNYFYNKTSDPEKRKQSVHAIFGYVCLLGIIGGICILIFQDQIVSYYSNTALKSLLVYVAFRPLLQNMIALYYPLYISNGMTKAIAVRNLVISICQIAITVPVAVLTKNITLIFILLLMMDAMQLLVLSSVFAKRCFKIRAPRAQKFSFDKDLTKAIFRYAVPLGISTMIGTLTISMDKLFVGRLLSVEDFAMYSNMSKELPFGFVVASFTTVVTPVIIKLAAQKDKCNLENLWGNYFEIGYITTWTLCIGALICAPELLNVLYSEKYAAGLSIFIIYLLVACIRITYFGLILTAYGKTTPILLFALLTIVINLVLNFVLFHVMGMNGLAIATFISIAVVAVAQLIYGSKIAEIPLSRIVRPKRLFKFLAIILAVGLTAMIARASIRHLVNNAILILIICYSICIGLVGLIYRKRLKNLLKGLNSLEAQSTGE